MVPRPTCWQCAWAATSPKTEPTSSALRRVRAAVAFALLLFAAAVHADAFENRQLYERALQELAAGHFDDFRTTKAQLEDYALYGYLEYAELRNRLRRATPEQVRSFRSRNADSPIANRLNDSWLLELSRRGAWQQYLDFYEGSDNVQLQCLYLRALDHQGEHERAMAGVAAL